MLHNAIKIRSESHAHFNHPLSYFGDQSKEDEMGGACGAHGGGEGCIQHFG
jgi:hypothetical protein